MKLSVALCTYNGARYLEEQLQSIVGQKRLPDELVVCDDRSSDGTMAILEAFAAAAPFTVRLQVNEKNLGPVKNFARAIELCTGNIIALCDQDDVWRPDKLARQEAIFAHSDEVGLVFSDAEIVDDQLQPQGARIWPASHFTPHKQRRVKAGHAFDVFLTHNVVTGSTMAFRSRYRELALPVPPGLLIHDGWIALIIAAVAGVACIDDALVQYRQHPRQHTRTLSRTSAGPEQKLEYDALIPQLETLRDRLSRFYAGDEVAPQTARIEAKVAHLQARSHLPARRWQRVPCVLRELLTARYGRYSNGVRSAARDLLL